MQSETQPAPAPKWMVWTGWIIGVLPALVLLASAGAKFVQPDGFEKGFKDLGWDISFAVNLGIVELICTIIYLFPRTSVLGAIMLTGYLGGATATHVRLGETSFVLPIILGVLVWVGLYLRDYRLRALLPLRTKLA